MSRWGTWWPWLCLDFVGRTEVEKIFATCFWRHGTARRHQRPIFGPMLVRCRRHRTPLDVVGIIKSRRPPCGSASHSQTHPLSTMTSKARQTLFIEAPISDEKLSQIANCHQHICRWTDLKFVMQTKMRHRKRKQALERQGDAVGAYMVWDKASTKDGLLGLRCGEDVGVFPLRLPINEAVSDCYDVIKGYFLFENLPTYRKKYPL